MAWFAMLQDLGIGGASRILSISSGKAGAISSRILVYHADCNVGGRFAELPLLDMEQNFRGCRVAFHSMPFAISLDCSGDGLSGLPARHVAAGLAAAGAAPRPC